MKAEERLHQYSEHCLHGQVLQTVHSGRPRVRPQRFRGGPLRPPALKRSFGDMIYLITSTTRFRVKRSRRLPVKS